MRRIQPIGIVFAEANSIFPCAIGRVAAEERTGYCKNGREALGVA
jgi:hypothetical protein